MTAQRAALLLFAAAALLLAGLKGRWTGVTAGPAPFAVSSGTEGALVKITGQVVHPGVYPVSDNKLTDTVIRMAMPTCNGTTSTQQQREQTVIQSGDQVELICNQAAAAGYELRVSAIPAAERLTLGLPLDLNRATHDELVLLPGVGPAIAQRIVEYRQNNGGFVSLSDLKLIEGIGEKKFLQLVPYINLPKQ